MHSTTIRIHADQEIQIGSTKVNVHDLESITIYENGKIANFTYRNKTCDNCHFSTINFHNRPCYLCALKTDREVLWQERTSCSQPQTAPNK